MKTFGRYDIEGPIGEGGMGSVYRAWDRNLRRAVALKILKPAAASTPTVRLRFEREARAAARLSHPNVVRLHEAGEVEGQMYLVMELVDGQPLDRILARGRFDLPEMILLLEKVARAVHHAHEHGIVHRDLKPGNILVAEVDEDEPPLPRHTEAGSLADCGGPPSPGACPPKPAGNSAIAGRRRLEPKVTDFGLARLQESTMPLTLSGTVLGTPHYMAPEQVRGKSREVDGRTDVYALGVILFEVLTGRTPFCAETLPALYRQILDQDPVRPGRLRSGVKRDLEAVCLKAMEKQRERRYSTALEFAEDLARYRRGESVRAHPPSVWVLFRRGLLRRKARLATVAGVLVMAAATAILLTSHQQGVNREAEYRRLQGQLKPLREAIQDTWPLFYIKGTDIRQALLKVEASLKDLQLIAADPANARYADVWTTLGMGWYFVGDSRRAEDALRKAEALSPSDGCVNYYLGRICLERSMLTLLSTETKGLSAEDRRALGREWSDKALEHLRRPTQGSTGPREIDRDVARAYRVLAEENLQEVLRLCDEGLKRFRDAMGTEEYHNLRGRVLSGPAAVDAYTEAINRRPHYAWAYFVRGLKRNNLGDRKGAIADYTRAVEINPYLGEAYDARGIARREDGDLRRAIADYTEAIRINPEDALARNNRGSAMLEEGSLDAAIAEFTEAIRINPRVSAFYSNRAVARDRNGDSDGAFADLDECLRLNPRYASAYLNRGGICRRKGELEHAISNYTKALDIDPNFAEAYYNRGIARRDTGELAEAIADYTEAIRLRPDYTNAYVNRANVRQESGDLPGALDDYDAAIRIAPNLAEAYGNRGVARHKGGDLDGAMEDYSRAIELDPAYAQAFSSRAGVWLARGEFDRAIADCTEVIRLDSKSAEAYYNRGVARRAKGDLKGAVEDYTEAIRVDPKYVPAWNNRGSLRHALGELDEAVKDYSEAIRLDPRHAKAYYNRGLVELAKGNAKAAAADFRKALEVAPAGWTARGLVEKALRDLKSDAER